MIFLLQIHANSIITGCPPMSNNLLSSWHLRLWASARWALQSLRLQHWPWDWLQGRGGSWNGGRRWTKVDEGGRRWTKVDELSGNCWNSKSMGYRSTITSSLKIDGLWKLGHIHGWDAASRFQECRSAAELAATDQCSKCNPGGTGMESRKKGLFDVRRGRYSTLRASYGNYDRKYMKIYENIRFVHLHLFVNLLPCHQVTTLGRTSSVTVGTVKPERVPSARLVSCRTCALPISSALCATQASSDPWWSMKTEGFVMVLSIWVLNRSHYLQLPLSHHPLGCRNGWGNHEDLSCKPYTCKIGSNESCAMCREQLVRGISIFPYFPHFLVLSCELLVLVWTSRSTFPGACCVVPTPVAQVAKARGSEQPQPMRGLQPWLWTHRWSHVPPLRL